MGPMIIVAENKGGSYILAEITGAVWHQKVAKFRVVPYFAREKIAIPEGIMKIIDMDEADLEKIKAQPEHDISLSRDYLMDGVRLTANENDPDTLEDGEADNIFEQ